METQSSLAGLREASRERPLTRRNFMTALGVASSAGPGMIAAGLSGFALTRSQRAEAAERIVADIGKLPKVPYGKTGIKTTRVCICYDWNPELFEPALAVGINFIHKAGYWGRNVPDVIKKLPRESYYTDITVDNTSPGHDPDNWEEAYGQVVNSLRENGLRYYDFYRAHYGWHTVDKFKSNNVSLKAFERLQKEGLVRHFGVSQHPYPSERIPDYPPMMDAETESGIIKTMQVWYSYGYPQAVEDSFARASAAGVSMTAMKVNAHGHGKMASDPQMMAEMKAPGMPGRAVLRWALSRKRPDGKPIFNTCVTALGNIQQFEENIGAVSPKIASADGFAGLGGEWA